MTKMGVKAHASSTKTSDQDRAFDRRFELRCFVRFRRGRAAQGPARFRKRSACRPKARRRYAARRRLSSHRAGSSPVLLMRLPYNKTTAQTLSRLPEYYASQCCIVAIQDVRGQYASQGDLYAFQERNGRRLRQRRIAAACLAPTAKSACTVSYVGATQWLAAVMRPPHLVAISPAMTSSDYYDGWSYEGRAWSLAFEKSWPIQTITLVSARRTGEQSAVAEINEATMIAKTYDTCSLHIIRGSRQVFQRSRDISTTGSPMTPGTSIGGSGASEDYRVSRFRRSTLTAGTTSS